MRGAWRSLEPCTCILLLLPAPRGAFPGELQPKVVNCAGLVTPIRQPGPAHLGSCSESSCSSHQGTRAHTAETSLVLQCDLSRRSDTDQFCTILLHHSEAMRLPESMAVVSCLHVSIPRGVQLQIQPSPPSLPTSLVHTQGASLEQRL